jgi:hypothetical protein
VKTHITCILVAFSSMLTCGCAATAIGVGVGAIVDHHHGRTRQATWEDPEQIPRGSYASVALTSDSTVHGEFIGLRTLSSESYRRAYDSVRAAIGAADVLPGLGDTVGITDEGGQFCHRLFHGFGALTMDLRQPDVNTLSYLPLRTVGALQDFHGRRYDLSRVRSLMASRALPTGKEVVVVSDVQTLAIPLEHVRTISAQPRKTHYWLLGGAAGLFVDLAIWTAIISRANFDLDISPSLGSGGGMTSLGGLGW